MLCKKPVSRPGGYAGCGQCNPCRISKRRIWTHRIMLESMLYADNQFVTLTYNDESLPNDRSVRPEILSGFVKRLRFHLSPVPIRYFGVGEYGDQYGRPHYHLAVFGLPAGHRSQSILERSWCSDGQPLGFVDTRPLVRERAQYLAGYVVKKMTSEYDERLCGLRPEFARMSNRPGIGAPMIPYLQAAIRQLSNLPDVPNTLQHGGRHMPLGRYLKQQLRLALAGVTTEQLRDAKPLAKSRLKKMARTPQHILAQLQKELQPLLEAARNDQNDPSPLNKIMEVFKPQVDQIERRHKLFRSKKGEL